MAKLLTSMLLSNSRIKIQVWLNLPVSCLFLSTLKYINRNASIKTLKNQPSCLCVCFQIHKSTPLSSTRYSHFPSIMDF